MSCSAAGHDSRRDDGDYDDFGWVRYRATLLLAVIYLQAA